MRILTTLMILFLSLSLQAQNRGALAADKLTEKLAASLKLDAEQKKKVHKANEDLLSGLQQAFSGEGDRRGRIQEARKLRTDHQQAIESILNPDQQKQYAAIREEQKQKLTEIAGERLSETATQKMQERLKLSPQQTKQVDSIHTASFKSMLSNLMDESTPGMQRLRGARQANDERNAAMKAILNDTQYAEYEKMNEEQRARMRERMQNRSRN